MFQTKNCRENQNIEFMWNNVSFPPKIVPFMW